jgi:hypothetical protein
MENYGEQQLRLAEAILAYHMILQDEQPKKSKAKKSYQ